MAVSVDDVLTIPADRAEFFSCCFCDCTAAAACSFCALAVCLSAAICNFFASASALALAFAKAIAFFCSIFAIRVNAEASALFAAFFAAGKSFLDTNSPRIFLPFFSAAIVFSAICKSF